MLLEDFMHIFLVWNETLSTSASKMFLGFLLHVQLTLKYAQDIGRGPPWSRVVLWTRDQGVVGLNQVSANVVFHILSPFLQRTLALVCLHAGKIIYRALKHINSFYFP